MASQKWRRPFGEVATEESDALTSAAPRRALAEAGNSAMIEEQLRSGALQTQQLSSSLADSLAKGARAAVVISQLSATSRRQAETIAKLRDEMARVRAGQRGSEDAAREELEHARAERERHREISVTLRAELSAAREEIRALHARAQAAGDAAAKAERGAKLVRSASEKERQRHATQNVRRAELLKETHDRLESVSAARDAAVESAEREATHLRELAQQISASDEAHAQDVSDARAAHAEIVAQSEARAAAARQLERQLSSSAGRLTQLSTALSAKSAALRAAREEIASLKVRLGRTVREASEAAVASAVVPRLVYAPPSGAAAAAERAASSPLGVRVHRHGSIDIRPAEAEGTDVWANASPAQFDLDDEVARLLRANSSLAADVAAPPAAGGSSGGSGSASRDATFAALTERIRQRKARAEGPSLALSSLPPAVHISRSGSVNIRGDIPPPPRAQPPPLSPERSSGGGRSVSY